MAAELKIFSLKWYLDHNPDVAAAVAQGLVDAFQHFELYGKVEGRSMGPLFDVDLYLQQNPDVADAVARGDTTAYDHFVQFGAGEGRTPSALFDEAFYLLQNPDVAAAVQAGTVTAVQHFLSYGQSEPRPFNPSIDLGAYLQANPDIAAAVQNGFMSAMEHLMVYGATEGRDLGNGVNLGMFANDDSFQQALSSGNITEALQRVGEVAPFLPTFQPPVGWAPPPDTPIPLDFVPPVGVQLVIPPTVVVPPDVVLPPTFTPPAPPGPTPGGGGTPATFQVLVDGDGVVTFGGTAAGAITMSVSDEGVATFVRSGVAAETSVILLDGDDPVPMVIHLSKSGDSLVVDGRDVSGLDIQFTGAGKVDITDVEIAGAAFGEGSGVVPPSVNTDISRIILPRLEVSGDAQIEVTASLENGAAITVNGSIADLIKASWVYYDKQYTDMGSPAAYYNLPLTIGKADLSLKYISYLQDNGALLTDFIAKLTGTPDVVSRQQSIHDNLLAELDGATLNDRLGSGDRADLLREYLDQAGDFADRGVISGYASTAYNDSHRKALAFDYEQGWNRPDYARDTYGSLDPLATTEGGVAGVQMHFGASNLITNFTIARHEGEGIELGLKAKMRSNGDYDGTPADTGTDAVMVYQVDTGETTIAPIPSWGAAKWSFDFSVATGLNGVEANLDDYDFSIFVDVDPTIDVDFKEFKLAKTDASLEVLGGSINVGRSWLLLDEDGLPALDGTGAAPSGGFGYELKEASKTEVGHIVSQNSVNFGFNFMRKLLGDYADGSPEEFGPGIFDIRIAAYDIGSDLELVGTQIQVQVGVM